MLASIETADDAAVYPLSDEQALIATAEIFMPIVGHPDDSGRIAATNAISDVCSMGDTSIKALVSRHAKSVGRSHRHRRAV
ncbi:Selenide,water dikinase [Polaromonas sp. CG9_12]|nr:Selenide,water dikinase [Polaromonas sp. CG9_12]